MRLKNTFLILLKLVVIVGLIVYLPSKVSSPSKAQVINAIDNSNQVTASYQNVESKVVKDKKIHQKVIEKVILYSSSVGFKIINLDYSPIKGPAGNIEYIVCMTKENNPKIDLFSIREQIRNTVEKSHKELK